MSVQAHPHNHPASCSSCASDAGADHIDPVCGMKVKAPFKHQATHEATLYGFCSNKCVEAFRKDPQKYLQPKPVVPVAGQENVPYTCPMHPEVRQLGPGSCPICGMALEPLTPTAGPEDRTELDSMTRRFWIALVLSVPLLFMGMADMMPFNVNVLIDRAAAGLPQFDVVSWSQVLQAVFATPVVL